jgi:hypothetical protein
MSTRTNGKSQRDAVTQNLALLRQIIQRAASLPAA